MLSGYLKRGLTITIVFLLVCLVGARVSLALQSNDVNGDNVINALDLKAILAGWLNGNGTLDIDENSRVNSLDAAYVVRNFGQPLASQSPNPSPPTITNLFTNGSFESGLTGWTVGSSTITTDAKSGSQALHITSAGKVYNNPERRTIAAGKTYRITFWMKFNSGTSCLGDCWGGYAPRTDNIQGPVTGGGTTTLTPSNRPVGEWFKETITIYNTGTQDGSAQIGFYPYAGSGWNWDIIIDDVQFFEVTGNVLPTINPSSNISSGSVPLSVNFFANGDDYDGAIVTYQWLFGDGSESRGVNPSHIFTTAGVYQVTLKAYDNDGGLTEKSLPITVSDVSAATVVINSPATTDAFTTNSATVSLGGSANTPSGQITRVTWDNINTSEEASVSITQAGSVNWSAGSVNLKPGLNEILVTAANSNNKVVTDKILITRTISSPSISNIAVSTTTPKVYEKYEVSFNAMTVADQPMFMYDPNPPVGAERYNGVTVEGVITLPGGQVVTQPAFYNTNTTKSGTKYLNTGTNNWKLRYSPQQTGIHQASLRITDKSGVTTTLVGSFTAQAPTKDGFIQVAPADHRYFEYSNGKIHWPIGMTWNGTSGTTPDGINLANSVLNYDRPWLGGSGIYSANWTRWKSTAEAFGNEGMGSHFSFLEHYPSSELSEYLHYPDGFRMWISCWLDENYCAQIDSGKTYQIKLRLKTVNLVGPRVSGKPYGLTVKKHGWIGFGTPASFESSVASLPALVPHINGTNNWHTVLTTFTATNSDDDFSIYLENVTDGQAYVDELSVREVLTGGALGPEQIRNSKADIHTYVEQRPMAYFDDQMTSGEQNNANIRPVVHDKNDWIQNHLNSASGAFVGSGDGYYQSENTKATWLLKQWWRYLVARLGYSTSIFGWELNNEGPPDNGSGDHARSTQVFAKWMHDLDAHPHLANTSFWCCWEPTFWNNPNLPDIDFADIHHYGSPTDMVQWYLDEAVPAYASNIGKPIIRGETGIIDGTNTNNFSAALTSANTGVWYHNLLWSQLHYTTMYEIGYWFPEHGRAITGTREPHAAAFYNFVKDLDVNKGGYVNIAASSTQAKFRIFGQRNLAKNEAYGWINHLDNTWQKVLNSGVPSAVSGTVTFTMNPSRTYTITWYNTYTGVNSGTEQVTSNSSGIVTLNVSNVSQDTAFMIN